MHATLEELYMDNRPIGVFDSGVGGLTVVKQLISQLPNENIIYFGDTARVPYGTKSNTTVVKYSFQNIKFLLTHNIKAIVVACNTASAVALDVVKKEFDLPILGVVEPGSEAAAKNTKNKRIGIIGTQATISSGAYERAIKKLDEKVVTFGTACSLLVPLVEEGWLDNEIAYKIVVEYLKIFENKNIDTLILGCTHYPLLIDTIGSVMGKEVELINPAFETAKAIRRILENNNMLRNDNHATDHKFFLSDIGTKFEKIANNCLNQEIQYIEKIDIEQY